VQDQPLLIRVLDRMTRQPMLAVLAVLCGLSIAAVEISYLGSITGPLMPGTKHVVTGDYLGLLTGAQVLADGHGAALYDLDVQWAVHTRLVGTELPAWQFYVYPPLFAVLARPLAQLPFVTGFYLHGAAMFVFGVVGALVLVRVVPRLARGRLDAMTLVVLSLAFHPMVRTMFGGQNTVLTWGLITGALWALQTKRQILAGILIGVLTYKPQYLPLLFVALLLSRSWLAVGVAAVVAVAHYLLGAAVIGADWPLQILATMRRYRPMEAANAGMHFSLMPFFQYAIGGRVATVLALACDAGVLAALVRCAPRARPGDADFSLTWALLVVTATLVSPHSQYYDFGILVLPAVIGLDTILREGRPVPLPIRLAIAAVFVAYPILYEAQRALHFQPLTLVTVALFAWLCLLGRDARLRSAAQPATAFP
jgi:hypothetical protein